MGGAAGHIKHPYEYFNTPQSLLSFFEDFFKNKFKCTEKVDGYNLFVGYNKQGHVIAYRNKNEEPFRFIETKFGTNHPAHDAFAAGGEAIKKRLEELSIKDRIHFGLIDREEFPKNFINLEILFGYIPNVVPYNKSTNYIVFHNFTNQTPKHLPALAKKLKTVVVSTLQTSFTFTNKTIEFVSSHWEFRAPIEISKKDLKEWDNVASRWKNYPETRRLLDPLTEEEKFDAMKAATKRIGEELLRGTVSKLSETKEIEPSYLGIEGIVVDLGPEKVKLTGNFLDYSKPEDLRIKDYTKQIREHIQKETFGLLTITLRGKKKDLDEYVETHKKKKFTYKLEDLLPATSKDEIRNIIISYKDEMEMQQEELKNRARTFDIKCLSIQAFKFNELIKNLRITKTYRDLLYLYANLFFDIN